MTTNVWINVKSGEVNKSILNKGEIMLRLGLNKMASAVFCLLFSFGLTGTQSTFAQAGPSADDQAIINGVTDFLAQRAQANAAYMFQNELKDSEEIKKYLPSTYKTIDGSDFVQMLKGYSQIWRANIKSDLMKALITYAANANTNEVFSTQKAEDDGKIIAAAIEFAIYAQVYSQAFSSSAVPLDKAAFQTLIRNRYMAVAMDITNIASGILPYINNISQSQLENVSQLTNLVQFSIRTTDHNGNTISGKDYLKTVLTQVSAQLTTDAAPDKALATPTFEDITGVNLIASSIVEIEQGNYSIAAGSLLSMLNSSNGKVSKVDSTAILLFSALAEAKSSTEVTTVLSNYLMPPVSFGEIREQNHLAIVSYVGVSGEYWNNDGSKYRGGIYAPIGLQYNWAIDDWYKSCKSPENGEGSVCHPSSLSLYIAPFDFGYPLTLKLKASSNTVTLSDVANPSAGMVYGFANYPMALGLAYEHVSKSIDTQAPSNKLMLFLSFDMPLYILK